MGPVHTGMPVSILNFLMKDNLLNLPFSFLNFECKSHKNTVWIGTNFFNKFLL